MMLAVDDLNVDRSGHRVLRGLSLTVRLGEMVVITGANGSGKSTALLAIAGRLPLRTGTVMWLTENDANVAAVPRVCGLLLQGGRVFTSMTVRDNLEVAAAGLPKSTTIPRLAKLSAGLPMLERLWNRRAGLLSGGERQVVALAMTLVREPQVLLLDEPLAGVDDANAQRIVEVLMQLRAEQHVALLVVEHRDAILSPTADRVLTIAEGRVSTSTSRREPSTSKSACQ